MPNFALTLLRSPGVAPGNNVEAPFLAKRGKKCMMLGWKICIKRNIS